MSNIPHRGSSPKEEIRTGKIMVIVWSVKYALLLLFSIVFLFDDSIGWGGSVICFLFSFVCIFGIKAGKETMKRGQEREQSGNTL